MKSGLNSLVSTKLNASSVGYQDHVIKTEPLNFISAVNTMIDFRPDFVSFDFLRFSFWLSGF